MSNSNTVRTDAQDLINELSVTNARNYFDYTHEDEANLYHDAARPGFFSILANKGGAIRQRSYKLAEMPVVLSLLDKTRDTWISQAEFTKPNRRAVNLWRVDLMFVDIDTYSIGWSADTAPEKLAQMLLYNCDQEGLPPPSIINFSGRGLHAKWLLENALPRAALPRWNAAQRALVKRLAHAGADPAARDISRILRVVQTTNSRSGEVCRVVHITENDGQPVRYDFDYLCEWLLPYTRDQLREMREQRAEEREKRKLRVIKGGRTSKLKGFAGGQLAWHRLEDLRKLAVLRGGVGEGERMLHLFWQLNFLLLSGAAHSSQMRHEAAALARAIDPSWGYDSSALVTLYAKAQQYEAGQRVEFNGRQYPALYTPRNDTLINTFKITDDEQRELRTIITPSMSKERDAKRKRESRAAAGATPHSLSNEQLKPWEQLGMSRRTWYRKGRPSAYGEPELSTG